MNITTAHRHVHVPTAWLVVAAIVVAALVIAVTVAQQPPTTTVSEATNTAIVALPGAASVAKPETAGLRHAILDDVYPPAVVTIQLMDYTHNRVPGATLDKTVPGEMTVQPYRLNQFESEP